MNIVHFTRSTLTWLACLYALLLAPLASASLLWQIEKEGKQNHIFGTIHVADRDIVKLPAHVDRVVSQADVLLLEVKQGAQSQQVIADRTTLQESTLRQLVGSDLYGQISAVMKQRGMAPASLQRLKPWAVGLMLNFPVPSLEPVLDVSLQYRFQNAGKPVHALETIDEQLDLFDRLTLQEQIEFLHLSLQQQADFDRNLTRMKDLYRAGDIDAIHAFAQSQTLKVHSPVMERLMTEIVERRNRRMFERLRVYLNRSGNLVAVGALHLPGEHGLLQLLRKAGYRVQPVRP